MSPAGSLVSGITPAATTEVVNMLNTYDLNRFGINTNLSAQFPNGDSNTLSEKWEGMTLLPDLSTADPTDFFLFLANDNDFLTTDGTMITTDGQVQHYSDSINNDTMFMVYRVSIPAPGTAGLLGLAGIAALRRRR
ncbi:MAG: PEP-CTERM sorting domain-containing protein [Phycisphaerales bacterium]